MTRVAGANPRIWVDIFLDNADGARARRSPSTGAASSSSRRALEARRRRLPRPLDRRGGAATAAGMLDERLRGRRRAAARARARARPAGRARRDHAGARRRADQHRGLRARSTSRPSAAARSTLLVAGEERGARGPPTLLEAQGYGVVVSPVLDDATEGRAAPRRRSPAIIAVPGDKSISHRALLLGALADGETLVRGLGPLRRHRVDARRGARARRARSTRTTSTRSASTASGLRGLRAAGRADRLRQRGHARCGSLAGVLAGQRGTVRARRRRVALAPADGADRRAAARDGRRRRDDRRLPAGDDRGRRAARRSATSCRSRARR